MAAVFAGLTLIIVRFAYAAVFGSFQPYDDEGFHLISLRGHLSGRPPYDEVFAQYGPFYYQVMGTLFRSLGTLPVHDTGRLLTLGIWVGASLLIGYALYRLTLSLLLGLVVQFGVFVTLHPLVNEPMHPGGLLVVLLIAIVAVSVLVVPKRPALGMFLIGALAMATTLVKVNVGVFALASAILTACTMCPPLARTRAVRVVLGSIFVLTPVALIHKNLGEPWAQRYAAFVALAAISLLTVCWRNKASPYLRPRDVGAMGGGVAVVAVMVPIITLAQGTSLAGLLRGLVTDPIRQADIFTVPLRLPLWSVPFGAASLLAAFLASRWWLRGGVLSALALLGGGVAMFLGALGPSPIRPLSLAVALPLIWLPAWSVSWGGGRMPSILVPSLVVLQALHSYPVAGSQVALSSFLLIPVAAIAVWEGQREIARALPLRLRLVPTARFLVTFPVLALSVFSAVTWIPRLEAGVRAFRLNTPLGLPGAHRLRLPMDQATILRRATTGLREHCSTFVSLPGLNSFYLFAGQEPPTAMNQSGWMYVFDNNVQRGIVKEIVSIEGLCTLRNSAMVDFWRQGRSLPERALLSFISHNFRPIARWGEYELLVRTSGDSLDEPGG